MKLYLVTGNKHKLQEAKAVFSEYNIEVEQIDEEKYEPKDMNLREISEYNAKKFYQKHKKPVIVDDTGVFFKAYNNFPGNHPKLMYQTLGYKGLLKTLEGEIRDVEFITVVAFCDGNIKTFEGSLKCKADTKVNDKDKDVLPYERILIVKGRPISKFSRDEKNKISHRAKAFRKVAEFLNNRSN